MHVVISDIDGTILHHDTYAFEGALPGLGFLRERNIPLVFCTSKTRAETEYWRREMGNEHPFIVENGGAVFIPRDYFCGEIPASVRRDDYVVLELGASRSQLVNVLEQAAAAAGCRVRGFYQMTAEELSEISGLPCDVAALALQREFDEPFMLFDEPLRDRLMAEIQNRGNALDPWRPLLPRHRSER